MCGKRLKESYGGNKEMGNRRKTREGVFRR